MQTRTQLARQACRLLRPRDGPRAETWGPAATRTTQAPIQVSISSLRRRSERRSAAPAPSRATSIKEQTCSRVGGNDGGGGGGEEGRAPQADASRPEPAAPRSPTIAPRNAGRDRTPSSENRTGPVRSRTAWLSLCRSPASVRRTALQLYTNRSKTMDGLTPVSCVMCCDRCSYTALQSQRAVADRRKTAPTAL